MGGGTYNSITREAKGRRTISSKPAWATKPISGQPGLHSKPLSQKTKKQNKQTTKKKKKENILCNIPHEPSGTIHYSIPWEKETFSADTRTPSSPSTAGCYCRVIVTMTPVPSCQIPTPAAVQCGLITKFQQEHINKRAMPYFGDIMQKLPPFLCHGILLADQ
jgi:hypothetical protein